MISAVIDIKCGGKEIVQKVIPTFHTVFHFDFVENLWHIRPEPDCPVSKVGLCGGKRSKDAGYITTGIKISYTLGYQPREMSRVA